MNANILKHLATERLGVSRLNIKRRVKKKSTFINHNEYETPDITVKPAIIQSQNKEHEESQNG